MAKKTAYVAIREFRNISQIETLTLMRPNKLQPMSAASRKKFAFYPKGCQKAVRRLPALSRGDHHRMSRKTQENLNQSSVSL